MSEQLVNYSKQNRLMLSLAEKNCRKLHWGQKYHRNSRGKPMDFLKLPFQIPIYKSLQHKRYVVLRKSVQNGISEAFVVSHLEEAERGLAVMYVLPKSQTRNTFVQNRVNKVITQVPFYQERMKDSVGNADSIIFKGFGEGVIKYVDSNSESNFVEFPGDALYIDEVDQCNQKNIAMAPDRLESSDYKLIRKVANPSVEDFGIDIDFKKGTQKEWFIRCDHCGCMQYLDWFLNVVRQVDKNSYELLDMNYDLYNLQDAEGEVGVFCRHCHKKIDRLSGGQFVARHQHREIDSFQISKLFTPFTSIKDLALKFHEALTSDMLLQLFYNSDLGLPFTAKGSKVSETMLNETRDTNYYMPDLNKDGVVCMGADVGKVINVIIRKIHHDKKVALYIGTVQTEDEVLNLMKQYNVKIAVIDAMPEQRMIERIKAKNKKVYSCYYQQPKVMQVNKKDRVISAVRTSVLDRILEGFNKNEYVNPANLKDITDYYDQMTSSTRIIDTEVNPPVYRWEEVSADHYFHAEGYCAVACEIAKGTMLFEYADDYGEEKVDPKKPIDKQVKESDSQNVVLEKIFGMNMDVDVDDEKGGSSSDEFGGEGW